MIPPGSLTSAAQKRHLGESASHKPCIFQNANIARQTSGTHGNKLVARSIVSRKNK